MSATQFPPLHIGKHVAPRPIIQGGMGIRISGANLAAAVANAGGIGTISAVGLGFNSRYFDPEERNFGRRRANFFEANRLALIDEIKKARELSPTGILAINSMVAAQDHETLVRTAAEQGINLIISGAGLPMHLPEAVADYPDVAIAPIISSVRAARVICRKWGRQYNRLPDALIVEEPRSAGGHLGAKPEQFEVSEFRLPSVIPELVAVLDREFGAKIPIIAAGGIWSRKDIERVLALGASGVQMGTRFITTEECDADIRYKEFHLQATPEDVMLVPSPVGLPGRALRNPFVEKAIAGTLEPKNACLASCLHSCSYRDRGENYCILRALDRAARGDVETGLVFAGENGGRAEAIVPVAKLMAELTGCA